VNAEDRRLPRSVRELRLPGSVAEVTASPPGPRVGAFFDLDGTMVAGFTGVMLTQDRLQRRDIAVGELLGMIQAGLNHQLGRLEFEELIAKSSSALKGRSISDMEEIGERVFVQKVESRIYPEMRELVRAHLDRGHTVVMTSSALTIQVEPVARFLRIEHTLTNRFETDDDGVLTGDVLKPILWGPGKASAVQQFAAEKDIDLEQSYFYADGDEDVALMYLVGNPRPTNPAGRMAAVARKRGWPMLRFTSRGSGGLTGQIRTLASVGSFLPAAAGGVGLGLLTRNRRRGVNFFMSTWPRLLLAAGGVRLNVIGEENLTTQRPAVFIFNHRNMFDPLITAALIRDHWTGVAKKEMEHDLFVGTMGKLMDSVFVDRDDTASAIESLHKAEELAQKGLSVLVAPEGTRSDTTEVGPFKKGPFRIAMAAGIPIVPIVIRNAEVIAARNSNTINPGTVDVAVFPPISVKNWTMEDLPDKIAAVRQLYLDTLKDWPVATLPQTGLYAKPKAAVNKRPADKPPARRRPRTASPPRKDGGEDIG
jgi:putative phosphoserine phosphatase / 1-acylglycerol-3-phosphate O-acyltransferase